MALTVQPKPTRFQHRLSLPSQHHHAPHASSKHAPHTRPCLHPLPECSSGFRVKSGRGVFVLSLVLSKGHSRSSLSPEEAQPAGPVSWPRLYIWGSPKGPGRRWSQGKVMLIIVIDRLAAALDLITMQPKHTHAICRHVTCMPFAGGLASHTTRRSRSFPLCGHPPLCTASGTMKGSDGQRPRPAPSAAAPHSPGGW